MNELHARATFMHHVNPTVLIHSHDAPMQHRRVIRLICTWYNAWKYLKVNINRGLMLKMHEIKNNEINHSQKAFPHGHTRPAEWQTDGEPLGEVLYADTYCKVPVNMNRQHNVKKPPDMFKAMNVKCTSYIVQ